MRSIVAVCILALVAASGADAAADRLRIMQVPRSSLVVPKPVAVNTIPVGVPSVPLFSAQDNTDPAHGDQPPLEADPWSDAAQAAVQQAVSVPNPVPVAAIMMETEAGVDADADADADAEAEIESEAVADADAEAEAEAEAAADMVEDETFLETSVVAPASCGVYANSKVFPIKGNGGKTFNVVYINKGHMSDPGKYGLNPSSTDNTMLLETACAFDKMYTTALKAGTRLSINSGFRTLARQQYLWNCYRTKKCNNGNLAASPGTSNHGIGRAVDINVNAGNAYSWMAKNAHLHGFVRTVPSEKWHWENRPGWKKTPYT